MDNGFVWKGIHSSDKNLKIVSLPAISTPEVRENKIIVPGRDGYLTNTDNNYEGELKSVEYDYFDNEFDNIKSWLSGNSKVIFSNEPDRYYKARVINKITLEQVLKKFHGGIVQFDCQPFGYLNEGNNIITIDKATSIYNIGNYKSEPYIRVYGTGDITLRINDNPIDLKGVEEYIELDTELMECFKGTQSFNNKMVGEFPYFIPVENKITWNGNISKIEIKGRWRSL
ncbi:distal tail protein Dit [Clostridium hydrogeniformans]|uniref:distal tail protein Dit n=1 Tax=Clostridium hydrogeniformans TaxID=349933 RepID=UPI000487A7C4|nr:distal tail protein Dit [Clostridium hydrogeniformans]